MRKSSGCTDGTRGTADTPPRTGMDVGAYELGRASRLAGCLPWSQPSVKPATLEKGGSGRRPTGLGKGTALGTERSWGHRRSQHSLHKRPGDQEAWEDPRGPPRRVVTTLLTSGQAGSRLRAWAPRAVSGFPCQGGLDLSAARARLLRREGAPSRKVRSGQLCCGVCANAPTPSTLVSVNQ